ncbi:MAG: sensor histidine kinase [Rhizobium sp.]|nr:sensor histidine kinase [Rhizobium sp.]
MVVRDQDTLLHRRDRSRQLRDAVPRRIWLLLILLITTPLAPSHAAMREALDLTGPADAQTLGRYLEYTIDPAWQLKVTDFIGPSAIALQPLPGSIPDFGYTPARIWLRLDVRNATTAVSDWRFFIHANFTQQVAIYRVASDGVVTTLLDLHEDSPYSARPVDSPQMVAPFELAPGESAALVVMYYSQGASRLSMSVETPGSFNEQAQIAQAKSYGLYGMMLVMIALATVAIVVLRQWVFAAYSCYVGSVLIYIAHADGTAFQYIWPDLPRFNSMASIPAGSAVMIFSCMFAITFLQTARQHRVMHWVLVSVIVSVLVVDVVLTLTDPQLLKRLLVVMISLSVLACLTAGLVAARTRFREVRFYVFAWCAGLIPAGLFTARFAFGIEPSFITAYDAVRLAVIFDALMMGLAIFDRYNHLRQAAMEETLAHAHRNLALSQRLALLEESYQRVSASARQREESVKDAVHDLRQPMHALRLSLRQLLSPRADDGGDIGQVESALGYMERLVADRLADAPQSEEGGTSSPDDGSSDGPHRSSAEDHSDEPGLHGVLRGMADMFAGEASAKGLGLRLVLAAPDAEVAAYPLMRVLANLVSNAIKYTQQGRIVIALRRDAAGYRVEVHDTGPGLSGAAFEHALVRNQRLDRDRDMAEGSGLGLSVVKEIADINDWPVTSCPHRRTGASIRIGIPAAALQHRQRASA